MAIETIKKNYEFRRVYAKGKSASTWRIVLFIRRNGRDNNRYGISISTKVGKAVLRNKLRRRLKEIIRQEDGNFKQGYDIIVSVRVGGAAAGYGELRQDLIFLARRLFSKESGN